MLKRIGRIFLIVNTKTAIVTVLAVAATWLCEKYGFTADLPLTLVNVPEVPHAFDVFDCILGYGPWPTVQIVGLDCVLMPA